MAHILVIIFDIDILLHNYDLFLNAKFQNRRYITSEI